MLSDTRMTFSNVKSEVNMISLIFFLIFLFSYESRDQHELELDFKRYWEEFRSSGSEKVACL